MEAVDACSLLVVSRVVASAGSTERSDFDPARAYRILLSRAADSPVWHSQPAAGVSFRSKARSSQLRPLLLPIYVGPGDDGGGGMEAADVSNLSVVPRMVAAPGSME